jgi:prefoldin subunit 5
MEITLEKLNARLDGLRKGMEEIKDELRTTSGAIQECEHWLSELTKVDVPVEPKEVL